MHPASRNFSSWCFGATVLLCLLNSGLKSQGLRNTSQPNLAKLSVDSLEEKEGESNKLLLELGYMSEVAYWGRNFGIDQFGLTPTIVYVNKSGFFAYYTGYYWSGEDHRYAKTDLGIGYQTFLSERLYAAFEYNRWFFVNGNDQSRKAFTNLLDVEINYDFDVAGIGINYYVMFGTEWAQVLSFELAKEFSLYRFLKADKWSFTPTFSPVLATKNRLPINTFIPRANNDGYFGIVNYELFLPIQYKVFGKFECTAAYHYNFPVNPLPNEVLKPFGYFTVDLSVMLRQWNGPPEATAH